MRNQQREVSDFLHQGPVTPPNSDPRHSLLQGGDVASGSGDNAASAASLAGDGDAPGKAREGDGRGLVELEELARMLEELHASMDTALDTVASAKQDYLPQAGMDTTARPRQDYPSQAGSEEMPPPATPRVAPSPASGLKRRTIILSSAGMGACVLVSLAIVGWWLSAPAPDAIQSAGPEPFISLDESRVAELSPDQATPGEVDETHAGAPAPSDISAAPARTDVGPAPVQGQDALHQVSLAAGSLRGVAGKPIPLGIVLPETAITTQLSVAVQGVSSPATLTGGMRLDSETWMVDAREAEAVALLTPATFPGGEFEMSVRLVSNDGTITPIGTMTVSVDPSHAFAAPARQAVSEGVPAEGREPSSAERASPPAPLQSEAAQAVAGSETAQAETSGYEPAPQPKNEARLLPPDPSLQQEEEVAATRPDAARPSLLAEPSLEAGPGADATADPAPSTVDAPVQESPAIETAATQAHPPADATASDMEDQAKATRTEPVNTHVNMRAEPSNDAAVVTVIPAGAKVGVIACKMWCEVTFDDKRGWIFKSFIGASRKSPVRVSRSVERPVAARPDSGGEARGPERPSTRSRGGFWKKILPF